MSPTNDGNHDLLLLSLKVFISLRWMTKTDMVWLLPSVVSQHRARPQEGRPFHCSQGRLQFLSCPWIRSWWLRSWGILLVCCSVSLVCSACSCFAVCYSEPLPEQGEDTPREQEPSNINHYHVSAMYMLIWWHVSAMYMFVHVDMMACWINDWLKTRWSVDV